MKFVMQTKPLLSIC